MLPFRALRALLATAFVVLPVPAFAIDVGHPEVTKGATELRNVNVVNWDDNDEQSSEHLHEFHLGHGVTDTLALKGIVSFGGTNEEDLRPVLAELEITNEIIDIEKYGFGLGWDTLFEFALDDDIVSDVTSGPIFKVNAGNISAVANTYVVRTFGRGRSPGTDFVYAWQATYKVADGLKVGLEGDGGTDHLFNMTPINQQEHRIGPAVFAEFDMGGRVVTLDMGLLFGVTNPSPDHEAKIILGTVF